MIYSKIFNHKNLIIAENQWLLRLKHQWKGEDSKEINCEKRARAKVRREILHDVLVHHH